MHSFAESIMQSLSSFPNRYKCLFAIGLLNHDLNKVCILQWVKSLVIQTSASQTLCANASLRDLKIQQGLGKTRDTAYLIISQVVAMLLESKWVILGAARSQQRLHCFLFVFFFHAIGLLQKQVSDPWLCLMVWISVFIWILNCGII